MSYFFDSSYLFGCILYNRSKTNPNNVTNFFLNFINLVRLLFETGTKGKSGSVSDISLTEGTAGEDVSFTTFVPPMDLNDRSFAAKFNVALSCIMLSNTIRIQCAVADAVRSGESVAAKTESWYLKLYVEHRKIEISVF